MNVLRYRNEPDLLNLLPSAATAAFNSYDKSHDPLCLPKTRVDVLQQIMAWADTSDERCIFWLNGMAGIGKSTIARTYFWNQEETDIEYKKNMSLLAVGRLGGFIIYFEYLTLAASRRPCPCPTQTTAASDHRCP